MGVGVGVGEGVGVGLGGSGSRSGSRGSLHTYIISHIYNTLHTSLLSTLYTPSTYLTPHTTQHTYTIPHTSHHTSHLHHFTNLHHSSHLYHSTHLPNSTHLLHSTHLPHSTHQHHSTHFTGRVITTAPTYNNEFMPSLDTAVNGANYYDAAGMTLYTLVRGSTPVDITTVPLIVMGFSLPAMTEETFFGANVVANMATFLGIPADKIKVVSIVRETARRLMEYIGRQWKWEWEWEWEWQWEWEW